MKRGPNKDSIAFLALQSSKKERRKLTLSEAILIQNSNYSRFSIEGDLISPEDLIKIEFFRLKKLDI